MSKRTSSSTSSIATAALSFAASTVLNGQVTEIPVPGGLQPAHGTGLDGKTKVDSMKTGKSSQPGKYVITDANNTGCEGTAHEIFVAAQKVANAEGYDLIAMKLR